MSERLTPEQLVEMIERSPSNPKASGVGVMRSGNEVRVVGTVCILALTAKLNAWLENTEETDR